MIEYDVMIAKDGEIKFVISIVEMLKFARHIIEVVQQYGGTELADSHKDETYLSTEAVCAMCNVSKDTVWKWVLDGYLVPKYRGKKKVYALSSVLKCMANQSS